MVTEKSCNLSEKWVDFLQEWGNANSSAILEHLPK